MRLISSLVLLSSMLFSAVLHAQSTVALPGKVQAEGYSAFFDTTAGNAGSQFRNDNVDIGLAVDTDGGFSVGWITAGEWLDYPVNVTQAGTYAITARVASQPGGGAFTLKFSNVANAVGPFAVGATGGWDTYTTTAAQNVTLAAGAQTLRLQATQAGFNVNWVEIKLVAGNSSSASSVGGNGTAVPGVVQAERYVGFNDTTAGNTGAQLRSDNVDIEVTADTGGGHNVGWTDTGEWLEFPITVTQTGNYQASVRVASLNGGGMFTLESGGRTLGTFSVNATGGWQAWTTLTANLGSLVAGSTTLRVQIQAGNFNLNWIELKLGTPTSSSTGGSSSSAPNVMLGRFNITKDFLLANFDTKPDPDDIHSMAALGTMLKDSRFAGVKYYAITGAYGSQGGTFLNATSVMNIAFPGSWMSAHNNFANAVNTVLTKVIPILSAGGHLWVQEAGQSNFTAAIVRRLQTELPSVDTRIYVHVVQHSNWNEQQTNQTDLGFVRAATQYNKINDGNPAFANGNGSNWGRATSNATVGNLWAVTRQSAQSQNNQGHNNTNIGGGGFDFSDASEDCFIFGFPYTSVDIFFNTFLH
jgi:hypothetical protein